MKKILIIIAALTALFAFIMGLSVNLQQEEAMWNDIGHTATSFDLEVTPPSQTMQADAVYRQMTNIADTYHANLIKTDTIQDGNHSILLKSVYLTYKSSAFRNIPLESGAFLKPEDMQGRKMLQTVNMAVPSGAEKAGELYSLFNLQKVRIQPLFSTAKNSQSLYGTYTVELKNPLDKSKFTDAVASALNMSSKDLTEQRVFFDTNNRFYLYVSLMAIAICFALFILLASYFIVSQFKKIGVSKLLGYTDFNVWQSIFFPVIFAQFVTTGIAVILLKLMTNLSRQYLVQMLIIGILMMLITSAVNFIFMAFIHSYTVSDLIKNKKPFRLTYVVNLGIRVVLLTVICVLLFSCVNGATQVGQEYKIYQQWDRYGNQFAVFNSRVTAEDQSDMAQDTQIREQKYANFYHYLNQSGAIYLSVSQFVPSQDFLTSDEQGNTKYADYFNKDMVPKNFTPYVFLVNPNYLKLYSLYDNNGKKINVSEAENDGVYLLPDRYRKYDSQLERLFTAKRMGEVDSSHRYTSGRENGKSTKAKIIYYRSGVEAFTFDTQVGKKSGYNLSDPVFSVMTEGNGLFLNEMNLNSESMNSPLKIYLGDRSSASIFKNMKPEIQAFGLEHNITTLTSLHSVFANEIEAATNSMKSIVGVSVLLMLLASWISIETIHIRMRMRNKKISVMKSFGYPFVNKYAGDILIFFVLWAVQFSLSAYIFTLSNQQSQEPVSPQIFWGVIPVMFIDVIVLLITFTHFDKKNIVTSVKEG